jgi:isopenicillin N synthase-like dioxygenase
MFWRIMMEVPESCPKVALWAETRMLGMKYRVWQYKLLLLLVLDQQQSNERPGLSMEVGDICSELGITNLNHHDIPASHIKKDILFHHDKNMMEEVAKSKKMMKHKNDDFSQVQKYMLGNSVDNCRMAFRIRCEMVNDIKDNFKDKSKRLGGEAALKGEDCSEDQIQTQSHCLICPHWEKRRQAHDELHARLLPP